MMFRFHGSRDEGTCLVERAGRALVCGLVAWRYRKDAVPDVLVQICTRRGRLDRSRRLFVFFCERNNGKDIQKQADKNQKA